MNERYFVTAIGTDSGKTLVSAILTQAFQADYWKPIQTGSHSRDTDMVSALVNNNHTMFYPEKYLLKDASSPHQAAALEGVEINLPDIQVPDTDNMLIIEGAGGVMVPLNDKDVVIDVAAKLNAEIILVSNIYLGSINHTLLTAKEIQNRGLKVKGIVFNGPENSYTTDIILKKTGYRQLLHIKPEPEINQEIVTKYAIELFNSWE